MEKNLLINVTTCPVCGSDKQRIHFEGNINRDDFQIDRSDYACTSCSYASYFDIIKCGECGISYLSVRPPDDILQKLYQDIEDKTYVEVEEGRYKTFRSALKDLDKWCPQKGRLFEIGSYIGIFFELASKDGWDVYGVELSRWARKVAKTKRNIELSSSLDEMNHFEDGFFDSVAMWDVIEHLPNPAEVLANVSRILKPGGILALSTVVLDSISARVLRSEYPFIMQMHLIYFTKKTLTRFLKRYGFEVVEIRRTRRFVSFAYALRKFPRLMFLTKIPGLKIFLKHAYFFSSMGTRDVYARKIEKHMGD